MDPLGKQPLEEFLANVAAATPAPGGGSSAAVSAALAAALVEMAAGLPSSRADDAAERARALRAKALRLAEEEMISYAPVLEARDEHEREIALAAASEPPAQVAETAAEVAELGVEVATSASPSVRGDALAGVVLAEAAASAAFRLVEINVGKGPVFERARQAELRAVNARAGGTGRPPPPPHPPIPR